MARFLRAMGKGLWRSTARFCAARSSSASGKSPLHMVAAWGCEQRLVLAQIATDAKSNEITAVPKLLEMLRLKGTIVTADALNCQRAIAQQIVDQGGDYALALKGNQGTLHDDVVLFFRRPRQQGDHRRAGRRGRSWPHRNPYGHGRDRHRVAEQRPSFGRAWPLSARSSASAKTAGKTTSQTAYYTAQRAFDARTLQRSRPLALGRRKSPALAARCRHERGSGPQPSGKRSPTISPFSATWPSTSCKRTVKRFTPGQVQASQLGRSLPRPAPVLVLKCNRPEPRRVRNAHPSSPGRRAGQKLRGPRRAKQSVAPLGFVDVELGRHHVIGAASASGAPLARSSAAWAISRSNHPHGGSLRTGAAHEATACCRFGAP